MTPDQQDLAFRLVLSPGRGRASSLEEFCQHAGIDDPVAWSLGELDDAISRRDPDDAEAALVVSAAAGRDQRWAPRYRALLQTDWHHLHEGAAFALGALGDADDVPALIHAAHHVPDYLEFDENRGLASKAIHSLGKIPGPEAGAALEALLVTHEDSALRRTVQRVLDRRRANPPADGRRRLIPGSAGR